MLRMRHKKDLVASPISDLLAFGCDKLVNRIIVHHAPSPKQYSIYNTFGRVRTSMVSNIRRYCGGIPTHTRYCSHCWAPSNIRPPPTTTMQLYIFFFSSSPSNDRKKMPNMFVLMSYAFKFIYFPLSDRNNLPNMYALKSYAFKFISFSSKWLKEETKYVCINVLCFQINFIFFLIRCES